MPHWVIIMRAMVETPFQIVTCAGRYIIEANLLRDPTAQ